MRIPIDGEQGLLDRLDFAQGAVMFAPAHQTRAEPSGPELVRSLLEIISALRSALAEADRDLDGAQRRVDGVNRSLIRLVVGAPPSPKPEDAAQRYEFGAGQIPLFTQPRWWTRLFV
ncbi:hypothetical protein [Enhygromyxa salina]|nr:hypothetical protein [Enhygromyxa salina]